MANPARGQLNRENDFSLSPFAPENLISRNGFGSPVPERHRYAIAWPDKLGTDPMAYDGIDKQMDAAAELGRKPVSKHQIQPEYGDEQADSGRNCRTRLARPNSQARTRTGKYLFSLFS